MERRLESTLVLPLTLNWTVDVPREMPVTLRVDY